MEKEEENTLIKEMYEHLKSAEEIMELLGDKDSSLYDESVCDDLNEIMDRY